MIVDHHDAAVLRERTQHVVAHVARVMRNLPAGGVRRDDRRPAHLDGVVEGLVGDVRDVDHEPQAIQLAHDVLAERREAVVLGLVGRGIGPRVVLEVREREVPHAAPGIITQLLQAVVDHVAAFHPHQRGDLVVGRGAPDVGRGLRQHEILGMRANGRQHRVDERVRLLDGRSARHVARHPNGEEERVEAAVAHARDVDISVGVAGADVERLVEQQPLRRVVVRIDDDGAIVELLGVWRHHHVLGALREHQHGHDDRRQQGGGAKISNRQHGGSSVFMPLPSGSATWRLYRRTPRSRAAPASARRRLPGRCRATSSRRVRPPPSARGRRASAAAARRER